MAAQDPPKANLAANTARTHAAAGGVAATFHDGLHGGKRQLTKEEKGALVVAAHATGDIFPRSHSQLGTHSPGGSSGVTVPYMGADGKGVVTVGVNAREATAQANRAGFRGGGGGALLQAATHELQHAAMSAQVMHSQGPEAAVKLPFEQQDHDHATMMRDMDAEAPGPYTQALRNAFNSLEPGVNRGAFANGVVGEVEKYTDDRDGASALLSGTEKVKARERAASFADAALPPDLRKREHAWLS